ncbi:MAG: hypothetical protein WCK82_03240 [Bacteroidota bacterium]|jgi:hypothetical protein
MAKYLVTFNDQINDIEIYGFKTMTEKEVENFERLAESITWGFSYKLGISKKLNFSDGEDFLSKLEFKELTFEEDRNLKKLFNGEFGTFITEDVLEQITKEDEDYIDDLDDLDEDNDYNDKDYRDTDFYSDDDDF